MVDENAILMHIGGSHRNSLNHVFMKIAIVLKVN